MYYEESPGSILRFLSTALQEKRTLYVHKGDGDAYDAIVTRIPRIKHVLPGFHQYFSYIVRFLCKVKVVHNIGALQRILTTG